MARFIRLLGKKRGERRTGSPMVGSVGEASFYGGLFLTGSLALAALLTSHAASNDGMSWGLGLGVAVFASLIVTGGGGLIFRVAQVASSQERRNVLASRAANIELIGIELLGDNAAGIRYPAVPDETFFKNSPGTRLLYRLPSTGAAIWKLSAATIFCLIWNGLSCVLVVLAFNTHRGGAPDWFLTVFVVPFVGVGVWAIYYFIRQLSMHAGIGATAVEISDLPLVPGRRYEVFVAQWGKLQMDSLDLDLVCDEEALFQQGTNLRLETKRVRSQRVFHQENFSILPNGVFEAECEIEIPADAMHSFQSAHNAIHWKLVVRGSARGWPEYERSFPVLIHPLTEPVEQGSWNRS